jgi:hypothetical protein
LIAIETKSSVVAVNLIVSQFGACCEKAQSNDRCELAFRDGAGDVEPNKVLASIIASFLAVFAEHDTITTSPQRSKKLFWLDCFSLALSTSDKQ